MTPVTINRSAALRFQAIHQRPPGLKNDGTSLGHHNRFPCLQVAGLLRFPPPDGKDAEATKFDAAILRQYLHDGIEDTLNDPAGVALVKAKLS
jgi:hypothetical protein